MCAEYVQVPEAIRSCLFAIRHTLFFLLLSHSAALVLPANSLLVFAR